MNLPSLPTDRQAQAGRDEFYLTKKLNSAEGGQV
jgi:hypothetical protein